MNALFFFFGYVVKLIHIPSKKTAKHYMMMTCIYLLIYTTSIRMQSQTDHHLRAFSLLAGIVLTITFVPSTLPSACKAMKTLVQGFATSKKKKRKGGTLQKIRERRGRASKKDQWSVGDARVCVQCVCVYNVCVCVRVLTSTGFINSGIEEGKYLLRILFTTTSLLSFLPIQDMHSLSHGKAIAVRHEAFNVIKLEYPSA